MSMCPISLSLGVVWELLNSSFAATLLGTFLGVLAGIYVQIHSSKAMDSAYIKDLIEAAKYEIDYALGKITQWETKTQQIQDSISQGNLSFEVPGFDHSSVVTVALNKLLERGVLYKKINPGEFGDLKILYDFLIQGGSTEVANAEWRRIYGDKDAMLALAVKQKHIYTAFKTVLKLIKGKL